MKNLASQEHEELAQVSINHRKPDWPVLISAFSKRGVELKEGDPIEWVRFVAYNIVSTPHQVEREIQPCPLKK